MDIGALWADCLFIMILFYALPKKGDDEALNNFP
jgi:hypothetical protein